MGGKQLSFFVLKQLTVKMERDILGKKKRRTKEKKRREIINKSCGKGNSNQT